ncbi:MAG: alpha/beta fold hydrolase [Candidatus Microthrix sp.]|uniref:Alpha/beta fold hydrolase n=1 Tax=Candidatus Neomicrothrix subdominans TaxID=2954438 RepID=A0A936TEK2_9ACTN|nr:alpha/beta fold hydrolase [Candidatus Microthrix subdominans]
MSNTTTAGPPQPGHPTATITSADGLELGLWHLGGEGPPLLLAHATGFAGGLWQPVAAHLTGQASCWAVDFRGHGHSPATPDDMVWTRVAEDAIAAAEYIVEATGQPVGAAGHSMGGAAVLAASARRPELFTAIWAYEPIIFPPIEEFDLPPGIDLPDPEDNPLAIGALRRRATFDDRVSARTNFSTKAPLNVFSAAAMEAYLTWGSAPSMPARTRRMVQSRCAAHRRWSPAPTSRDRGTRSGTRCPRSNTRSPWHWGVSRPSPHRASPATSPITSRAPCSNRTPTWATSAPCRCPTPSPPQSLPPCCRPDCDAAVIAPMLDLGGFTS